jgi:hypothetical protein
MTTCQTEVPPLKLTDIFVDTSPTVPVVFILVRYATPLPQWAVNHMSS